MIFLSIKGFSLVQIGLLEGIYHVTGFLMEVPTGIVADLWGRKASRLIGRVIWSSSLFLMFYPNGFFLQALGFALCALGNTLESGAEEALVYDSLLLDGNEAFYPKVGGINEFLYQATSIVSYMLGGLLALYDWTWVFGLSFIFAMAACATGLFFIEPGIERPITTPVRVFHAMWSQMIDSLSVIRGKPRIAFLIVSFQLLEAFLVSMFFYLQIHWKHLGMNELQIMTIFSIASAVSGLGALLTHRVKHRFGDYRIMTVIPLLIVLFMAAIAFTRWQYVFYIAIGSIDGLFAVYMSDYINRLIPSVRRATIISLGNMMFSTFMIVLFPLIGLAGDTAGLPAAFVMVAVLAALLYVPYIVALRKIIVFKSGKRTE
jgi:MFS family permease